MLAFNRENSVWIPQNVALVHNGATSGAGRSGSVQSGLNSL
jgi:hypothetical protein